MDPSVFDFNQDTTATSSWFAVCSSFVLAETTVPHILMVRDLLLASYDAGGIRAFATTIKGWSRAVRSVLSRTPFDAQHVGFCKHARNYLHFSRNEGISKTSYDAIVSLYGDSGGIPPFLFFREFHFALLPDASIEDKKKIAIFANLSRTAPQGDKNVSKDALIKFEATIGKDWNNKFSLRNFGRTLVRKAINCRIGKTRINAGSSGSYDYVQKLHGKDGELLDRVITEFGSVTLGELIKEQPTGDLFDITGNLFLRKEDWDPDAPMSYLSYPLLRTTTPDNWTVHGLIALLWAVTHVLVNPTIETVSDCAFPGLHYGPFNIHVVGGYAKSRVAVLPEEGYKSRIITITEFSVGMIGAAARFLLDPIIWNDSMSRIGLLSPIKLYSVLREMSGGLTIGLSSDSWSFGFQEAVSADLTTATDSPYSESPKSLFEGMMDSYHGHMTEGFLRFATQLATLPRQFLLPSGREIPSANHRCGIMMGEGLSGIYLNAISCFVRYAVHPCRDYFYSLYSGYSVEEADAFIELCPELIQEFLDEAGDAFDYDRFSSQSGDDTIVFHRGSDLRRFMILLYRMLGLIPSESTFYSSEFFGTFTEEMCLKTPLSNGWVFLDIIKPRLFSLRGRDDPISSMISRIGQITSKLRYGRDRREIEVASGLVDLMISKTPAISDRIQRYGLVAGLPDWLGGIGHPNGLHQDFLSTLPPNYTRILSYLKCCSLEELFNVRYAYLFESSNDELNEGIRSVLLQLYTYLDSIETSDVFDEDLHMKFSAESLYPRGTLSFVPWMSLVNSTAEEYGLVNFHDAASVISSGMAMQHRFDSGVLDSLPLVNPMIKLRDRVQKMTKLIPSDFTEEIFGEYVISTINGRLENCSLSFFKMNEIFPSVGISGLPNSTIQFQTFV